MRNVLSYLLTGLLLALALLPVFPGVLRGEMLVPGAHLYRFPPWAAHRPEDLPEQNPQTTEVPISVCVWYAVTDMVFARGEWPLWNPLQFTGAPLLANLQSAIFYPPRLLFRIFNDMPLSMTFFILLRFWLCGFNAFVAARLLGIRIGPARFFSLAYMLAGYNLRWAFYPPPDVMAWFPYLFVAAEWLLDRRYRRGFLAMTAAVTLMILPGHPSTFLLSCMGLAFYALARLLYQRSAFRRVISCGLAAVAAFGLAIVAAAIQILPFLEYLPRSTSILESQELDSVRDFTYTLADLFGLFAPRFLGTELEGTMWGSTNHTYLGMLYLGIPVWAALLLLFGRLPFTPRERLRVRCLLGVSALCLYLSTGLPGASFLYRIPVLDQVRPAYALAFGTLAVPLAAAYALQAWLRERRPAKALRRPAAAAAAIIVALALLFVLTYFTSFQYIQALDKIPQLNTYLARQTGCALAVACVALLAMAAFSISPARSRHALPVLCILLVADQAYGVRGLIPTTPREHILPRTEITAFLQAQQHPCRVRFDTVWADPGYAAMYGIEELHGYDAIYPERVKPVLKKYDPSNPLWACPYAVFSVYDDTPEGYRTVLVAEAVNLAENLRAVPRARLVKRILRYDTEEDVLEAMDAPGFDPVEIALTATEIAEELPGDDMPLGTAAITEWGWHAMTIQTEAPASRALVLADLYYPGWQAEVDGAPTEIFPVYHYFRGVMLSEGRHVITFRYRPQSFRIGAVVSTSALLLMCGGACFALLRGRRRIKGIAA